MFLARIASTCWITMLLLRDAWRAAGEEVRLNQIQVIGTHNFLSTSPPHPKRGRGSSGPRGSGRGRRALDYTHRPPRRG